jgi:hypothetical protein
MAAAAGCGGLARGPAKGYVLAVPVNFPVRLSSGRKAAVSAIAAMVPAVAWETRSCGPGCKGRRDYAWAWAATSSARHWLLARRSPVDPSDLAFYYCHVPQGRLAMLTALVAVTGKRWPAEQCHQQGNGQTGLDQHQVRLWHSFHRHTVLSMCAQALLAVAAARPAEAPPPAGTLAAGRAGQPPAWRDTGKLPATPASRPPAECGMVKVSVPEARRLARIAAARVTRAAREGGYAWSRWRRRHQARARWHHYHARLKAAAQAPLTRGRQNRRTAISGAPRPWARCRPFGRRRGLSGAAAGWCRGGAGCQRRLLGRPRRRAGSRRPGR